MKPISITHAKHYIWGSNCDGWHLLERDDISVIQEHVPAGKSEVTHFHNVARQFFYILEGTAAMQIHEETITLKPGEGIEIPPKMPHQFRNDSEADVSFLVISIPKSHGDRVDLE